MKMTVPDILRNRFRGEAYPLGTFMGTPHGNGGGPISTKEIISVSLSFILILIILLFLYIERRRNKEQ